MYQGMAGMAQRNEIISEVTPAMAAQLLVMDLQRFHAAKDWHRHPSRSSTCL